MSWRDVVWKKIVNVTLINKDNKLLEATLISSDESERFREFAEIEIESEFFNEKYAEENYFDALLALRKELENLHILIQCNGAGLNIYPSAMQQSMGTGRTAYVLNMGEQGKMKNVVDIFDYNTTLNFVTIEEQKNYFNQWLSSLG